MYQTLLELRYNHIYAHTNLHNSKVYHQIPYEVEVILSTNTIIYTQPLSNFQIFSSYHENKSGKKNQTQQGAPMGDITNVSNTVCVVTGGGSGIGAALCREIVKNGARVLIIADLDGGAAERVAKSLVRGGTTTTLCVPWACDVAKEVQVAEMVRRVEKEHGPIYLYASNAGVISRTQSLADVAVQPNADWERCWAVNVMAHVYAMRALLPGWKARKQGRFLITASAAGLLSAIGDPSYSTTKHAAVGLAESIAITHRDDGILVYCLCPQAVDTPFAGNVSNTTTQNNTNVAARDGVITVEAVVAGVMEAFQKPGAFLILPHKEVGVYIARKTQDYSKWIAGMQRWRRSLL